MRSSDDQSDDNEGREPMGEPEPNELGLLAALRNRKGRAMHVAELCKRVGVPTRARAPLLKLLDSLAHQGLVTRLPGNRFRLRQGAAPGGSSHVGREPARRGGARHVEASAVRRVSGALDAPPGSTDLRSGRLGLNPRGFGFVSMEQGGPDVFVPPTKLSGALHGDHVRLRMGMGGEGPEGEIMEITARGTRHVSGVLRQVGKRTWIETDDPRLWCRMGVAGSVPEGVRAGMAVIARIVEYPSAAGHGARARIVEALDATRVLEFELRKILIREGVSDVFPEDVLSEAARVPSRVLVRERRQRTDLRSLPLVTIDPDDAKDHDDAVWAERLASGGYRVIVAIADVTHYVAEGSAMDREALDRGCTIYLPDRAVPMLPESLSSQMASLVPNHDRLAMAVEVELSKQGEVQAHRFQEAVIRSRAHFSYAAVARALGLTTKGPFDRRAHARRSLLQTLLEVAEALGAQRRRRGSLEFDLPEARVAVHDETGHPVRVYQSRKDPGERKAYNLIEELMLLANEVVAKELTQSGAPTVYRVHPPPDEQRMETFAALANAFGYPLDEEACRSPKQLAAFLRRIDGTDHARSLGYLLLRAMQQASYATVNIGHFGLAASHYLHFTSPIRRYPDVAVHRMVKHLIRREQVHASEQARVLTHQADVASRLERRAMTIEREVTDLYAAKLMSGRVGDVLEGSISGVASHGFYVTLDDPFVDVLCPLEHLDDDYYELDEHGLSLRARSSGRRFTLGDRLTMRVTDVSLPRRQVYALPEQDALRRDARFGDTETRGHAWPAGLGRRPPSRRVSGRGRREPRPNTRPERPSPAKRPSSKRALKPERSAKPGRPGKPVRAPRPGRKRGAKGPKRK